MNTEDVSIYREHPEVGGKKYVRCDICGKEVVPADPDSIRHKSDCKYGHSSGDSQ
jgi:RecJ-like exonuclease